MTTRERMEMDGDDARPVDRNEQGKVQAEPHRRTSIASVVADAASGSSVRSFRKGWSVEDREGTLSA